MQWCPGIPCRRRRLREPGPGLAVAIHPSNKASNMTEAELATTYRDYIACLNAQDWPRLGLYVAHDAVHNGRRFGLDGYREMLENDFREIPDLRFDIDLVTCDPPNVAARLAFDCTPVGEFQGLPVNGKRITF